MDFDGKSGRFCPGSPISYSLSLRDSNSTRTRTGACITQNHKDWRSCKLHHKHSHSPCTGRPATTFEFSDLGLLCSKDSN